MRSRYPAQRQLHPKYPAFGSKTEGAYRGIVRPSRTGRKDDTVDARQDRSLALIPEGMIFLRLRWVNEPDLPRETIGFDHDDLLKDLGVGVKLGEEAKEVIRVCPSSVCSDRASCKTYRNHSSQE